MKWVLIFAIYTSYGDVATNKIFFNDEYLCDDVKSAMEARFGSHSVFGKEFEAGCYRVKED